MAARSAIKKLIPQQMMPIARTIYRKARSLPLDDVLSPEKYRALPALKCSIAYNIYGGYCVPKSSRHMPAAAAILDGKIWEPATIAYIAHHCGTGDVVHAGTFFGDFLPALAHAHRVWAFEPSSENFRCAKITVELNDLKNVTLTHAGLGARHGELFLQTHADGAALGGCSRIATDGDGEHVKIVSIDDTVGDRVVSLIQLDVEGFEKNALEGALQTIRRCRPILILEMNDRTLLSSAWFAESVLSLGYQRAKDLHDNAVFTPS